MRHDYRKTGIVLAGLILANLLLSTTLLASFQTDYDAALATFRSAKAQPDYQKAAEMFVALSANKNAGPLHANTLFWLAECYYGMKGYVRALNSFERVLLIPRSNKEEDSRYKVAACYIKLGWNDAARWELTRFLRDYPSSSKADLVRKELNKIPPGTRGN